MGKLLWYTVVAIVALVLIASYLPQITAVAGFVIVILVIYFAGNLIVKRFGGKGRTGGNYCSNCPHPSHGRQPCGTCNCRSS